MSRLLTAAALSLGLVTASPAAFHVTLTDTAANLRVEQFGLDHHRAPTPSGKPWSVRKVTLRGGKQEGVDVIEVDNGRLRFTVVPTRGMNVHKLHCGDITLGWNSPVRELVHPSLINPADRGGLGWLDGFNEWMARCGYEFAGHPGEDDGRLLTLHGKASNLPASKVEVFIDPDDPERIHVRGRVEETMFKFADLELVTDISTVIGSTTVRFDDVLTNRGSSEQEFQVIYHSNYGEPLLEEGARFAAPVKSIRPFDARAAEELDGYEVYAGPTPGYGETVYCLELHPGDDGRTTAMLHNKTGNRGVALTYPVAALPHFALWKNTDVGEKGYVTGLEPATGYPYNRAVERERGRVPTLPPGGHRRFLLDVEVLPDGPTVNRVATRIATLQKSAPPVVHPEPEE